MCLVDHAILATETIRVGVFRCPPDDRRFATAGQPAENHLVVFPRTGVWIRHAGSRPFLADPGVATIYNRGQEYTRTPLSPDGDRSDWFAIAPATALAIMRDLDPSAEEDLERPFQAAFVRTSPSLYARQRRLFVRAAAGTIDALEFEETAIEVVATALRASPRRTRPLRRPRRAEEAHRDLAFRARAHLMSNPARRTSVTELASELEVSPYHLCRTFKLQTGKTLHEYRLDLRLRLALERLERATATCSELAFELGFSSHSHFTWAFRRRLGYTPSDARRVLSRQTGTLRQRRLAVDT